MRLILVILLISLSQSLPIKKQLAGPPSEFANFPTPEQSALLTSSYTTPVYLSHDDTIYGHCWSTKYPVETPHLTLTLMSPWIASIMMILVSTSGELLDLQETPTWGNLGYDGVSIATQSYELDKLDIGTYTLEVCAPEKLNKLGPDAVVGFSSRGLNILQSNLITYDLTQDNTVGLNIRILDNSNQILQDELKAILVISCPYGETITTNYYDDGQHQDQEAGDGVYGVIFEATEIGNYITRTEVTNNNFYRSANHIIPIITPLLEASNLAYVSKQNNNLVFEIPIFELKQTNQEFYVKLEVWATNRTILDILEPVAWIASLVNIRRTPYFSYLELSLNLDWMYLANLTFPLQLQNLIFQDVNTGVLIAHKTKLFVELYQDINLTYKQINFISEEMLNGPRPQEYIITQEPPKLILVHGYCSGSVWPIEDFDNAVEFQDFGQSRTISEFANLLYQECDKYSSCVIIAHSQGGLASLHLKAFYWSGLDKVNSGRVIQTLGAPFQGCSLAGFIAELAKLFGWGCGSQFDLTPSGAQLWLSTIPQDPRSHVYYYTTEYYTQVLVDSCVTGANLFLYTPNDGTCERKYSKLEHGHFEGTHEGWCHISNMAYPPQCEDPERNALMNKLA